MKFEAEPEGTHVFRKASGDGDAEDLGVVPLELKVARDDDRIAYLLRAAGHKDRTLNVEPTRDQVLHVTLEKLPVAADPKKPKPAPTVRPVKPKKPVIHDADGMAVPSF